MNESSESTTVPFALDYGAPQDRLRALYDLALEISALRDLPSVLNTALEHCLALTGSEFGFIGLNSSDGRFLDVKAIQGFNPTTEFYMHSHLIPLRPSLFAQAILDDRPVRSADAVADRRYGQPAGHPPVLTFLGVPLRVERKPIGMIGVANRSSPYDESHEQLLMTYATQVAIAINNARLNDALAEATRDLEQRVRDRTRELNDATNALAEKATQLQKLLAETVTIQERERQRISHDLHDGLNQLLVGALLELRSGLERLNRNESTGVKTSLKQASEIIHQVEQELRQTIFDLRPPMLDSLGLVPSLARYAKQFENHTQLSCKVETNGKPFRMSESIEIGLYRIMQEALQNVQSHARASNVEILVAFQETHVAMTVTDNGCGFVLGERAGQGDVHFGLMGMHERAQAIGGMLQMYTSPGHGTMVSTTIPVQSP